MVTVTLIAAISLCGWTLKNKMHSHTEGLFWHRYPGAVAKEEMGCGMDSYVKKNIVQLQLWRAVTTKYIPFCVNFTKTLCGDKITFSGGLA